MLGAILHATLVVAPITKPMPVFVLPDMSRVAYIKAVKQKIKVK